MFEKLMLRHTINVLFLLIFLSCKGEVGGNVIKLKPTMVGEPLTPHDFENAAKYRINKTHANDMSIDDGTENDIIVHKKYNRVNENPVLPWTNGIVPYLLDDKFNETDRMMIAKGIMLIESATCIKILPRITEPNYILIRKNILTRDCSGDVGMRGGKQLVNLAERCIQRVGSISHEFMHGLGFYHEQSRIDRDDYVTVHFENVLRGAEANFEKKTPPYANMAGAYDTQSITHYSNFAFSANGEQTINSRAEPSAQLGQREKLTELDIRKINGFYNCPHIGSKTVEETEQGQEVCSDFDPTYCKLWGKHEYCEKSPLFMAVYCKVTCDKCEMGCVDINEKCGMWSTQGWCNKYDLYMKHYCRKSCKIC